MDRGFVAVEAEEPVGAAWYRFLPAEAHGYGFVDASTPELTVGVVRAARRRGIGTYLIEALLEAARAHGVAAVSLSVEEDNPALRLYERCRFERLRLEPGAWTMLARLSPAPGPRDVRGL